MASKNTILPTEGENVVEVNLNQVVFDPSELIVDEDVKYPEGGTEAWLVVFGAWCAMVSSMGLLNTLAVLQAWVLEHDLSGMSESTVGWIFGAYGFFLYFCGAQVGPIFDAHDIKLLIIPGSVGMVASMIFLSLSKEFYQFFLSFGVLGGISASLLFNPSLAAIGHWFSKRRAFATGIACTAGGTGGIVFPLIILFLAPRIGFAWAIRVIGLMCTISGILACCFLRKRLPPNKKAGSSIDLKALSDYKYATTTLAIFLVEFAVFIPYTYISSYALHHGFKPKQAYLLNTLLSVGGIPGRALPGYVADRFGIFNTMCVTTVTCATLILALWYTAGGDQAMTISFTMLFGFWSGAAISLTPVCVGQVCKIEDYGKRSGTTFFIASFGALTGIPIAGAIIEANHGSYQALIIFAGVFYMAALGAFILARGVAGGWSLRTEF
ncbi:major facilitator superfamily domain-containing protein [Ilyonectria destructans]|nr:major facilitator superfamily domain-containing protein [Ilyonectria destructans]